MRVFGRLFRYFLNINFIWGFMILLAFVLCVAQHYMPSTTTIAADDIPLGESTLTIRAKAMDKEKTPTTFAFDMTRAHDEVSFNDADMQPSDDHPWIASIEPIGEGFVLKWDYRGSGDYTIGVRQFQPLNEMFPPDAFAEGANTMLLREAVDDDANDTKVFAYTITRTGDVFTIPADQQVVRLDRPNLVGLETTDDGVLATWAGGARGHYEAAVQRTLHSGTLITLTGFSDTATEYAMSGFELALGLVATMVLFLGLMKVGEDAGVVQIVARIMYPVIRFLFPEVPRDHPANGAIVMNWTTTLLGLGNAATPFGIKAMKELQSLNPNPHVASNSQIMLLGYNTAGLALVPTTLLAVRKSAGCSNPFEIIGTCMFAGLVATIAAIVAVKLLGVLPMFSVKAALAEDGGNVGDEAGDGATKNGEDA